MPRVGFLFSPTIPQNRIESSGKSIVEDASNRDGEGGGGRGEGKNRFHRLVTLISSTVEPRNAHYWPKARLSAAGH